MQLGAEEHGVNLEGLIDGFAAIEKRCGLIKGEKRVERRDAGSGRR